MGAYAVSNAEHVQTSGEPLAKPSATRRLMHILSAVLVVVCFQRC